MELRNVGFNTSLWFGKLIQQPVSLQRIVIKASSYVYPEYMYDIIIASKKYTWYSNNIYDEMNRI